MDVGAFFTAWMKTFNDSQSPEGAYPNVSPKGWGVSPAWGDAGVICPYVFYWAYGDQRIIREHYDGMCAWIAYLKERSNDLIRPAEGFGDWLNVDAPMPKDVISTAYFAWSTRLLSEMANIIGKKDDAVLYMELADDIKEAFVRAFISEDGRIKGDTQTCYLMALSFDLVPNELKEACANRLVELIEERDYHLSTGFLGVNLLLPTLTRIGRLDLAYRLLQNTTYPSWGYSIVNGATTIWERWNSYTRENGFGDPGMNSFNHYAYGSCGEWMFSTMAGIAQETPGYEIIRIAPRPSPDMDFVAATYDSIRGRIATKWTLEEGRLTLDVTVPPNTTAHVYIPCTDVAKLLESGKPVISAEAETGCGFAGLQDGVACVEIGSGTYRFTAPWE
jgi:alpha-L-rhamnosidase